MGVYVRAYLYTYLAEGDGGVVVIAGDGDEGQSLLVYPGVGHVVDGEARWQSLAEVRHVVHAVVDVALRERAHALALRQIRRPACAREENGYISLMCAHIYIQTRRVA